MNRVDRASGRFRIGQSVVILIFFSLVTSPVQAYETYKIRASEIRLLPKPCRALSVENYERDAIPLRSGRLPPGYPHIHHFCHGMKYMVRADRAVGNRSKEKNYLVEAVREISVVINKRKRNPNNKYMALLFTQRGKAEARLKRFSDASVDFKEAITSYPRYVPAITALSDLYKKLGKASLAASVVKQGLKNAPRSKSLQRRAKELQVSN